MERLLEGLRGLALLVIALMPVLAGYLYGEWLFATTFLFFLGALLGGETRKHLILLGVSGLFMCGTVFMFTPQGSHSFAASCVGCGAALLVLATRWRGAQW